MPDYLEKYQGKVKEDNKKDDKPIQGMINTIKKIKLCFNFFATRSTVSFSVWCTY